ncbi:olfactory receptor 52E4-like [Pleurodeles waltl]|uniref:olfactory receptor 52E4-like n=1 Tax=Pleurodeles waltl TaxID=8319 RepID=UPI003709C411
MQVNSISFYFLLFPHSEGCLSHQHSTCSYNATIIQPSHFILIGIPGLEDAHHWISIPFCVMYVIALMGNSTILLVVKMHQSLHEPLFLFLSMLAGVDLVLSTTTMPKMLAILWLDAHEILFATCLMQMFLIHMFTGMESGILLAMAFDRFVAICHPFRYASILTNAVISRIGVAVLLRNFSVCLPFVFLTTRLPYCRSNVIAHCYCEHMGIVKLACADTTINSIYGLMVARTVLGMDITLIVLSYVLILRVVLNLPTQEARHKAFSTCTSHVCVMLIFYIPAFFSFLTHRFGHNIAPHVHIIVANLYVLMPPMLNPVIYGVRTKHIHTKVLKMFTMGNRFT